MSLSNIIKQESLQYLIGLYSSIYEHTQPRVQKAQEARELLEAINELASQEDIFLARQSEATLKELIDNVYLAVENNLKDDVARNIYERVKQNLKADTSQNQARHKGQGRFDTTALHLRAVNDQLQDHDMTRFMPKSHGNIEVLAVVNQYDPVSVRLVLEGIQTALRDATKKHILIPVGPGHYRLMSIQKPGTGETQYSLSLFGPYGQGDGAQIEKKAKEWLGQCGISAANLAPTNYEGPTHRQPDGYACGDYTCAQSHKKMRELGADTSAYDQRFINVLEASGNQGGALRNLLRNISRDPAFTMGDAHPMQAIHQSPSVAKKEPAIVQSEPKEDLSKKKRGFTEEEKRVFKANFVSDKANKKSERHFKQELTKLIFDRHTIFSRSEKLGNKPTQNMTDEELAMKLQAQELRRVFKK